MDINQRINMVRAMDSSSPNAEEFLNKLKGSILYREQKQKQFLQAVSAALLVLLLGLFTVQQLQENPEDMVVVDLFPVEAPEPESEEFIYEMASYLVDQSNDMIETLAFLEEVDFGPVKTIMEDNR
ncbi:MAG: hypothetical protein ACE5D2_00185 [Fidelibacterota bacterium]